MRKIVLRIEPFPVEQIPDMLKEHGVLINHYAEEFFSHPRFSMGLSGASNRERADRHRKHQRQAGIHRSQVRLRHCEKSIEPQFAFGYGMSYTTFDYSGFTVASTPKDGEKVVMM